ncbi:MAG: hypothetical protein HPY44_16660 [Armatimonadetes bacterium]|nr:hypothetical protein [Armatimonadota bacterium]
MSKRRKKQVITPEHRGPSAEPRKPLMPWPLLIVIGAYLLLAVSAALIVPRDPAPDSRLTPPDESAHWLYVKDLAERLDLPVFTSGSGNYEAHQPPLYYLSVLWTFWLWGDAGLIAARLCSVLLGAITIFVAWQLAAVLVPGRGWVHLGAAAALAFTPGRLFVCASVSNDPLFELLAACTLYFALRWSRTGIAPRRAALIGLSLAAGLLTKTSTLILVPVVGVLLLVEPRWRRGGFRYLLANSLVIGGLCAVVWGWWVLRNFSLYGEPLALGVFQRIFLRDRPTPEFFLNRGMTWSGYWTLVAMQGWMSVWGVFGQATVYMPRLFYSLGNVIGLASAAGLVAAWWRGRDPDKPLDPVWPLAGLACLLTLGGFVQFNMVFYQAQARYFLGVSAILAAALSLGVSSLQPRQDAPHAPAALAVVLFAMSLWAVVAHLTGGYSFTPPFIQ